MSPIDTLFARLRSEGRKAFIPFVTAGDPDLDFTAALVAELGRRGAALCELGIPYSDPIADGPVIQASYTRALGRGIKLGQVLDVVAAQHRQWGLPVVTMVSYAIIHRHGPAKFLERARAAGVAGAIVPDLLIDESAELARLCREQEFSLIHLVTPTTPRERALRIAERSTGFLYYVSVTGITGERTQLPPDLLENVAWLRARTSLPICIGFGISRPEHVRLLAPVADGLIVGSAIMRRVEKGTGVPRQQLVREIGEYAAELMAAFEEPAAQRG